MTDEKRPLVRENNDDSEKTTAGNKTEDNNKVEKPDGETILEVSGIVKRFLGVLALGGVSFALKKGEIHVLLGENGAGKSTLIKCLSGVYRPDEGHITVEGKQVKLPTAKHAENLGIATIHQEFNLVNELSVAENIVLGRYPTKWSLINKREMYRIAQLACSRVGLEIDLKTRVGDLGMARQQLVEIAKALSLDARVLIMDEPTATLTDTEVDRLLELMRQLRANGVSIIFISHHLDEIRRCADRVTILRDGKSIATVRAKTSTEELVRLMVGRSIDAQYPRERSKIGDIVLEAKDLGRTGKFDAINLNVRSGEVVGLAGLVGSGRTEVLRAIFGADKIDHGVVTVAGVKRKKSSIGAAIAQGLGLVPEDRKGQGLILEASVAENLAMVDMRNSSRAGLINRKHLRTVTDEAIKSMSIKTPAQTTKVQSLSGGNQQKVVMGKWLTARPEVLLLDEPTRGVDVGAKVEIYNLINKLTTLGKGVLMVSSDLPEILGMCDRIYVMAHGRIVGELTHEEASQDAVMALAVKEVESSRVE